MNPNKSLGSLWQVDTFKYPRHSANLIHPEGMGRAECPAKIWRQVNFKHFSLKLQSCSLIQVFQYKTSSHTDM